MKSIVLDASVALAWSLDRPTPTYANHVAQLSLSGVQAIVPLEMANGFAVAERRRLLTSSEIVEALRYLDVILAKSIEVVTDSFSIRTILGTARAFSLTAYDAVYLETALRHGLALATLHRALRAAAAKADVDLITDKFGLLLQILRIFFQILRNMGEGREILRVAVE